MTLLEKAIAHGKGRRKSKGVLGSKELAELAIAWFEYQINDWQLAVALNGSTLSIVYNSA